MTSGDSNKRQPLYRQSNIQAISGAGKPPSRVHPISDKEKHLIACSYNNILTERNVERGKEVTITKK